MSEKKCFSVRRMSLFGRLSGGLALGMAFTACSGPSGPKPNDEDPSSQGEDTSNSSPENSATGDSATPSGGGDSSMGMDSGASSGEGGMESGALKEVRSMLERDAMPKVSDEQRRAMRDGNVDFSFELLRRLSAGKDKNLAVSAPSIRTAFGMVHTMAKGDTQKEIAQTLNFLENPEATQAGMNDIDQSLMARNLPEAGEGTDIIEAVVLETANRVFLRNDTTPGKTFLDKMALNYGAGVYMADFKQQSGAVLKAINDWVSKKTRTRIPEIVTPDDINPTTVWAMINAVYFKAPWAFDMEKAGQRSFKTAAGSSKEVDFVRAQKLETTYGQHEDFDWVEFPLRDKKLAFVVMLPKADKFEEAKQNLSAMTLESMRAEAKSGEVEAYFPKFKFDTDIMDLIPSLKAMGMQTPFSDNADFSGYSDTSDNLIPITFALHRVFIAADERGVEAAAATAVGGEESGPNPAFTLDANRPFLFTVYDRPTGLVLFAGQVMDPS